MKCRNIFIILPLAFFAIFFGISNPVLAAPTLNSCVASGTTITISGSDLLPTSSDYVQNGLVAHYDSINNLGTGDTNHSTTTTTWHDLTSNNNDMTLNGITGNKNGWCALNGAGNCSRGGGLAFDVDGTDAATNIISGYALNPLRNNVYNSSVTTQIALKRTGEISKGDCWSSFWGAGNNINVSSYMALWAAPANEPTDRFFEFSYANNNSTFNSYKVGYGEYSIGDFTAVSWSTNGTTGKTFINSTLKNTTTYTASSQIVHNTGGGIVNYKNGYLSNYNLLGTTAYTDAFSLTDATLDRETKGGGWSPRAIFYAVRMYNRQLTDTEETINGYLDLYRFNGGAVANAMAITVNGKNCVISSATATSITCTMASSGAGALSFRKGNTTASGTCNTAPTVTVAAAQTFNDGITTTILNNSYVKNGNKLYISGTITDPDAQNFTVSYSLSTTTTPSTWTVCRSASSTSTYSVVG